MYRGPWPEKLIAAIKGDGGKMAMEDLAAYEVIWTEPVKTDYAGYEILANGLPAYGGVNLLEALNVSEAAGIGSLGHWSKNPGSFRRLVTITGNIVVPIFTASAPHALNAVLPGEFPDALLEETALPIEAIGASERRFVQGLWVGIARDPESGELKAGSHYYTNGRALAY